MVREERDSFDQQRLAQFRRSMAASFFLTLIVASGSYFLTRGPSPELAAVTMSLAGAYLLLCIVVLVWRLRRPESRGPERVETGLFLIVVAWFIFKDAPTLFRIFVTGLPLGLCIAGGFIAIAATKRHAGSRAFCAGCHYEKTEGSGERCPECATRWGRPGATIRGERAAHIPRFVLGLALAGAGWVALWLSSTHRDAIVARTPVPVLLNHWPYANHAESKAIVARLAECLIPADRANRIAERLLDSRRRQRFGFASPASMDWIVSEWKRGVLNDAIIERLARESAELSLRLAGTAGVGRPVAIEVGSHARFAGADHQVMVIVETFVLDDGTELVGRGRAPEYPNLLESRMFPQYTIRGTFTPAATGRMQATLAYWLIITDGQPGALSWNEHEGVWTPSLAASGVPGEGPPIWSKRYTTTLDFTVEP
jgi:hypothetical protein